MKKDGGFVQATAIGRGHTSELYLCKHLTQVGRTVWEAMAVPILPYVHVCSPHLCLPHIHTLLPSVHKL